jgi:hypothetical protein
MLDVPLAVLDFLDYASAPWRFLLSANYRRRRQEAWSKMNAPRAAMQIIGEVFIFHASIAVIAIGCWALFFR